MQLNELGTQILGPIVADFIGKVARTASSFELERKSKVLFAARAGMRIASALEVFEERTGMAGPKEASPFWISRLMAAKGVYSENPRITIDFLNGEFHRLTLRDFVEAMLRNDPALASIDLTASELASPATNLAAFLESGSEAASAVVDHFHDQSSLFREALAELLGDRKSALIVDTGWQGSIQTMLSEAVSDIDWWGAYFGRNGVESSNRKYFWKMLGLMFEQDQVTISHLPSTVIEHRHMIEALFEPQADSIEHLQRHTLTGKVIAPGAEKILSAKPDPVLDSAWLGVMDYLSNLTSGRAGELRKKANEAWERLAKLVLLPTRAEASIYLPIRRSHDLGRVGECTVLLEPTSRFEGDTAEIRINQALWEPGQIAIEYPEDLALQAQLRRSAVAKAIWKSEQAPAKLSETWGRPKVAIITRTMDRPMFLERAIRSVQSQTFQDYIHVIVCDGGDISKVQQSLERVGVDRRRTLLIDNVVNRGMEAASNIGIRASDSDYIVIHDDDDTWEPSFLAETVSFLDSPFGQHFGGVITQAKYVSEEIGPDGIRIHNITPYNEWLTGVHVMQMAMGNTFPPISFLFRRSAYDKVGHFDENFPVLGDWDFNLRLLQDHDIGVVAKPISNYHHRDRGNTALFGNSVIAERDRHALYAPIVRNRFARNLSGHQGALPSMVGMGLHFDAVLQGLRQGQQASSVVVSNEPTTNRADSHVRLRDEYHVAIQTLLSLISSDDTSALEQLRSMLRSDALTEVSFERLVRKIGRLLPADQPLLSPRDFDGARYLELYPELADVLNKKEMPNAFSHFFFHGFREGRARPSIHGLLQNVAHGRPAKLNDAAKGEICLLGDPPPVEFQILRRTGSDVFLHPVIHGPVFAQIQVTVAQPVQELTATLDVPDDRCQPVEFGLLVLTSDFASEDFNPDMLADGSLSPQVKGLMRWVTVRPSESSHVCVHFDTPLQSFVLVLATRVKESDHFAHAYFRGITFR